MRRVPTQRRGQRRRPPKIHSAGNPDACGGVLKNKSSASTPAAINDAHSHHCARAPGHRLRRRAGFGSEIRFGHHPQRGPARSRHRRDAPHGVQGSRGARASAARPRGAVHAGFHADQLRREVVSADLRGPIAARHRPFAPGIPLGECVARPLAPRCRRARAGARRARRLAVCARRQSGYRQRGRCDDPRAVLSRQGTALGGWRTGRGRSRRAQARAPHRRRIRGVLHLRDRRLDHHDAARRQAHHAARDPHRGTRAQVEHGRRLVLVRDRTRASRACGVPPVRADGHADERRADLGEAAHDADARRDHGHQRGVRTI